MDSPIPKPCLCMSRGRAWGCHTYHITRIGWHPENCIRSHPQAALEDATRISSIPSGGILNPPPRLLVEDNGASHPFRESGGGLGMVSFTAEHVQSGGRACEGRQRGLTFLIESVIINICQLPICQPQTPAKTGALGRFCS
jgi:hypothetical protein